MSLAMLSWIAVTYKLLLIRHQNRETDHRMQAAAKCIWSDRPSVGRLWTTQAVHVCWAADGESKSIVHHSYELASTVTDACSAARMFESL